MKIIDHIVTTMAMKPARSTDIRRTGVQLNARTMNIDVKQ
jgi:hypothetical protein